MEPIDLKTAREMVERYKSTRKTDINDKHGVNDTESSWFSIDKLKEFVNNLPAEATGVRLHLGIHGAEHDIAPNQTSLAMIATVSDGNGNHIDAIQSDNIDVDGVFGAALKGRECPPTCQS